MTLIILITTAQTNYESNANQPSYKTCKSSDSQDGKCETFAMAKRTRWLRDSNVAHEPVHNLTPPHSTNLISTDPELQQCRPRQQKHS
eukprot:4763309-Amphidinium_carterae.1